LKFSKNSAFIGNCCPGKQRLTPAIVHDIIVKFSVIHHEKALPGKYWARENVGKEEHRFSGNR
jgi:hypothetical protein